MLQYRKDYRQYENGFTNVGGVSYCGTKIKTVIIQERSALPEKVMQVVLSENSATEAAITT